MKWLILVLGIASNASASVLIKIAMMLPRKFPSVSDPIAALSNWQFWLGGFVRRDIPAVCRGPGPFAAERGASRVDRRCGRRSGLSSALIFHEPFPWTTGAGILCVIAGVALITARAG